MKTAMMNYILRSSGERKRLHILTIPRSIPPASYTIYLKGGYSSKKFENWQKSKIEAETEIKLKLLTNNIVMSALTNWWFDFRDIQLVKINGIRNFCESTGYRLNYNTFLKIMEMHAEKSKNLLKDIWHRGVIMIVKRFKYLRKRGLQFTKWTFRGPVQLTADQ
jgi:hypothetical protein